MSPRLLLTWVALGLTSIALVGPARADGEGEGSPAAKVDYKVVVWYRKSDPIDTFEYQTYDVRKNEYTPAVDEWVEMMRTRYPNYEVVVRDVDISRETGPTETRKVGSVIYRELLSAAAAQGVFVGPEAPPLNLPKLPERPKFLDAPILSPGPYPGYGYSPILPMFYQNPLPAGFPVPMPYPRPHP